MASPFGGIDPEVLKQIQALMQGMGPSAEDKAAARSHALLTAGLGMMQNANMNPIRAAGYGGLLGAGSYNDELKQLSAQRAQNMGVAMQVQNMMRQQQLAKQMMDALNGEGGPQTQPGPPQPFQAPGGAAALMNSGVAGTAPPTNALQTQVTAPPNPMATRDRLVNANLINNVLGGKDMSAAIKMKYPDPIPLREGAGYIDPATGKYTALPKPPPGYFYNPQTNSFDKVSNGAQAEAASQSVPKAVAAAWTPQVGIGPGGKEGIVGTELGTLFGNGPLPYGAPSPFPAQQPAPAPSAYRVPPGVQSQRDSKALLVLNDELTKAQARAASGDPSAAADIADLQKTIAIRSAGTTGQNAAQAPVGNTFVQTKLSPEQQTQSKNLGEYEQTVHNAATTAGTSQAKLDTLTTMFDRFTPGPTMPIRSGIASYAQEVPGIGRMVADALVPNSAQALPAIAAVKKLAVEMTAEQSKVFGSREGQQVIGMIKSALPSIESVPGAPQIIMQSLTGLNRYHSDTERALSEWKAEPSHNGSIEGFQESWNKTNPPSKYVPMDKLTAIVGGAPSSPVSIQVSPKAQGNKTAQTMIQNVLNSGDQAKIQELRTLGWIK